jgi:hypothetical protein
MMFIETSPRSSEACFNLVTGTVPCIGKAAFDFVKTPSFLFLLTIALTALAI